MKLENVIYCGDNLTWLKKFPDKCVDLIYLDPPFFSNRNYEVIFNDGEEIRSFEDRWKGGINHYVDWMKDRVFEMHRILKDTGSFYLHCDWHASHYLKVMCDDVFGSNNFRNEIVWCYRGAGYPKRDFGRRHDIILRYSKTKEYTFNLDDVREPYAEATVERFKHHIGNVRKGKDFGTQKLHPLGKQPDDWWEIQPVAPSAKERYKYPTQKPEPLLEKIIKASSNKDDLVLDPFCGCGTTIAVAQRLGRKWIGIDVSPAACKLMKTRVEKNGARGTEIIGQPLNIEELKKLPPFEFQNWCVGALGGTVNPKKVGDMGIDGFSFMNRYPIQVKQSESVGRNVVDNFETAMQRAKQDMGYIIAFSFTKGAYEEVAEAKQRGLHIELLTVEKLLEYEEPAGQGKMF
jgi:site-specific DNA-methyltransferase (adenine-specific)